MSDIDTELDEHGQALLDHLLSAPGQWYVVHTFAGHERKAATNIGISVANNDLQDVVYQIEVPMETAWEVRNGERRKIQRVKLPGYVLVRMEMDHPYAWTVITSTQGVTRFVGNAGTPVPIGPDEVFQMIRPEKAEKRAAPEPDPAEDVYAVGDAVRVVSGPFETLPATVSDVNAVTERITVMVELFGRETPVELAYNQVTRL